MISLNVSKIFSTVIYCFDNVLDIEYVDSMREDILKSSQQNDRGNWQSEDNPNLHEHPKYKNLGLKTLELSKKYMDDMLFEYNDFHITGMWSNILKPGEMHSPHTHSNNIVSGVFYVDTPDNTSAINFIDPRPQTSVIQPHASKFTKENSTIWSYPAVVNRMILFPSWLQHYVPINKSNKNRISIAFNLMLKGMVGRPNNFQSAEF